MPTHILIASCVAQVCIHVRLGAQTMIIEATPHQDRQWAAYSVKRVNRVEVKTAVDDSCLQCYEFWKCNLMPTMTLATFISKVKGAEVKHSDVQTGLEIHKEHPAAPFKCADIGSELTGEFYVEESGLFLSEADFKKYTGGLAPRDCGVSPVVGLNAKCEKVKGYAIQDPNKPWRTWTFRASSAVFRRDLSLASSSQVLPGQGNWVWDRLQEQRAAGDINSIKHGIGCVPYSLEELQARAAAKKEKDAALAEGGEEGCDGSGDELEDLESDEERIVRAGVTEAPQELHTPKTKSKVRGSVGAPSVAGMTFQEGSVCSSGGSKKDGRLMSAEHWIDTVKVEAFLLGPSKLGRERCFAEQAVDRLAARSECVGVECCFRPASGLARVKSPLPTHSVVLSWLPIAFVRHR